LTPTISKTKKEIRKMADPITTSAGLQVAKQAAPIIIGAAGQANMNRKNRKWQSDQNEKDREWSESMYERQNADQIKMWEMTNQYNHPTQQMERLRQAGLNPNLVYGKGADNTATMVKTGTVTTNNQPAPKNENWVGPAVKGMQDAFMQAAQIRNLQSTHDNISKQNALMDADIKVKDAQRTNIEAQTAKTLSDNDRTVFDLKLSNELRDTIKDNMIVENALKHQAHELNFSKFDLEKLRTTNDVKKTLQDIVESKQRVIESRNRVELSDTQKLINEGEIRKLEMLNKMLETDVEYKEKNAKLDYDLKSSELDNKDADLYLKGIEKEFRKEKLRYENDYIWSKRLKVDREAAILLRNMLSLGMLK
jgi:hypothetical protein